MATLILAISSQWSVDRRLEAIAQLAKRLENDVLVVHAIYGIDRTSSEAGPGEKALEQITAYFRAQGMKCQSLLLFSDDIPNALLKTADEHKASMMLLGLSTKGMLARLLEGSVPQELIKATRIPVMVIPPDWQGAF